MAARRARSSIDVPLISAVILLPLTALLFLLTAPTFVAFPVVVAGASLWCRWLETTTP